MDEEPGTTKDDATRPESTPPTIPTPPPAREKYGLSQVQLTQIMDFNDKSGIKKVQQYGGVEDIANHLRTNLKDGLPADPSDHEERKREFGINYIEPIPPKSFLALMYDAIQDPVLLILLGKTAGVFGCCIYYSSPLALSSLPFFFSPSSFFPLPFSLLSPSSSLPSPTACAVISIALSLAIADHERSTAWIEGFAILMAVVIVVIVTAINDYTKEQQFRDLQKKLESTSKCVCM